MTTAYGIGDQFVVPVDRGPVDRGWVRGVVARADRRGTILGYFFEPFLGQIPAGVVNLDASDAFLVVRFLETGFTSQGWPVLGPTPDFEHRQWAVPVFREADSDRPDHAWRVRFDDAATREVSRRSVPLAAALGLEEPGAISSYALRQRLSEHFGK